MQLQGRVALITGGAGGIGGAVVRSLAKAGVSGVAINYRKSSKEAADLAAEIERGGKAAGNESGHDRQYFFNLRRAVAVDHVIARLRHGEGGADSSDERSRS